MPSLLPWHSLAYARWCLKFIFYYLCQWSSNISGILRRTAFMVSGFSYSKSHRDRISDKSLEGNWTGLFNRLVRSTEVCTTNEFLRVIEAIAVQMDLEWNNILSSLVHWDVFFSKFDYICKKNTILTRNFRHTVSFTELWIEYQKQKVLISLKSWLKHRNVNLRHLTQYHCAQKMKFLPLR